MGIKRLNLVIVSLFLTTLMEAQQVKGDYDIVVYGATSAGVIAAYTAKQMGKSVVLIEPGKHVGGLSSGGLGMTDIGNKYAITGLSLDFYRRIGQHYGTFEQWIFEPHVAENIFLGYLKKANVPVLYSRRVIKVDKTGRRIREITLENTMNPAVAGNIKVRGKIFIDCSYEGDLMPGAGVSYTIGREANTLYNETINGVQLKTQHQFPDGVDPYKIPGKPESGLLWGINNETLAPNGTGDKKVQAYNIRICLTNDSSNSIPITEPEDYNPERYELLLRLLEKRPVANVAGFMTWSLMPNKKTDINNKGAFSTDMIGVSWDYPDADYKKRADIQRAHDNYIKGLLYFAGHDPRLPEPVRKSMLQWGYPKDEYTDNGHWTTQMYVREARRMTGEYVMTQANCQGKEIVEDGIGLAAYTMDSHNAQRLVVNGMVKNEGDVQVGGFPPYPISYRSIVPRATECENLLVPVCLSASHIAYGSIRMEPVFMVLAQSASVAACIAIDDGKPVQQADVKKIQRLLKSKPLADNSLPEILADNDNQDLVTRKGNWQLEKNQKGCYGPSLFSISNTDTAESYVRFQPNILKDGIYELYSYLPKIKQGTSKLTFRINNGSAEKEVVIKPDNIVVLGQTSGEWVALGSYSLKKGSRSYVDITNKNADGLVLADAVLFVPKR